jgi:hypothetical protein
VFHLVWGVLSLDGIRKIKSNKQKHAIAAQKATLIFSSLLDQK